VKELTAGLFRDKRGRNKDWILFCDASERALLKGLSGEKVSDTATDFQKALYSCGCLLADRDLGIISRFWCWLLHLAKSTC
jgi:hypothetical protein